MVYILAAVVLTSALSLLMGGAALRALRPRLERWEAVFLAFTLGSAILGTVVFLMTYAGLASLGNFLSASAVMLAAAVWGGGHRLPSEGHDPVPGGWRIALLAIAAVFGALYLSVAMAPEASFDGTTHYLAEVSRYAGAHGLTPADFDEAFPDGVEMLYLFAFSIGGYSAAATVSFLYLLALPLGILAYARRIGQPVAGVLAALLFFLSPIAARVGTIAAPDIAIACTLFAAFYLFELSGITRASPAAWSFSGSYQRQLRLLIPAAALSVFLVWIMTPWLLREFAKPVLHLNGWYAAIPLDLAIHGGRLGGLLGPVFLLSPLALFVIVTPAGRRLLAMAAFFSLPCLGAMEARVLVPALPFLALSLALVLARVKLAVPAAVALHVVLSWPAFAGFYAGDAAWMLQGSQWRAALRIEPEDGYLSRSLPGYRTGRLLDSLVPDGERILTLAPFQEIYHSRTILDGDQSREGRRLREVLWAALVENHQPVHRQDLRFEPRRVRKIGLLPAPFSGQARWGINEVHAYYGETELSPTPQWRIQAAPNPVDAPFAIDGSPVTRWTSGRTAHKSMGITLDFGRPVLVDRLLIDAAADQERPAHLMAETAPDQWEVVEIDSTGYEAAAPADLRRAAIRELRRSGVDWLLVHQEDRGAELRDQAAEWGIEVHPLDEGYLAFDLR